jgi:hypothetical protein
VSAQSTATVAELLRDQGCPVNPARALVRAGLKRRQADRLLATPMAGAQRLADVGTLGLLLAAQAQGGTRKTGPKVQELALALLAEPKTVCVSINGPDWLEPTLWLPADGLVPPQRAREVTHLLHGRSVGGRTLQVNCDPPLRIGRRPPPRQAQRTRRRRLFSRWSDGIQWDDQGLYSATPEVLARDFVRGARGVALDAGCGLGSLTLALAAEPAITRVIAVDNNARRLGCAKHNAGLYGLAGRIEFRLGDVVEELSKERCDVLVADPPWGGRDYDKQALGIDGLGYDLAALLRFAPADTRLKLPASFRPESLPGVWAWRPAVDDRGVLKFLVATRA